jgi:hypothetical protein
MQKKCKFPKYIVLRRETYMIDEIEDIETRYQIV